MPQQRELWRGGRAYLLTRPSPRPTSPHPSSSLREPAPHPPSSLRRPRSRRPNRGTGLCHPPAFSLDSTWLLGSSSSSAAGAGSPTGLHPSPCRCSLLIRFSRRGGGPPRTPLTDMGGSRWDGSSSELCGQGLPRQWSRHGAEAAAVEAARSRGRPGPEISGAGAGFIPGAL